MSHLLKKTLLVVCLTTSPLSFSAAQGTVAPLRSTGPLADSLRAFAVRMGGMLRARDVSGLLALYGDTSHFVQIDDGHIMSWPDLSAGMRAYLTAAKSNPVTIIGEPGVTIMDDANAVVYVVHHFDANNGRPAHTGVWTGVLHRGPNGWKIVHSHSSDVK